MIIDFLIQFEPRIQTDITDYLGIALVMGIYFWLKHRRTKLKNVTETAA
jgi:hypothetical protein